MYNLMENRVDPDQTARSSLVRPRGYKKIFMLNSTGHEIFLLINVKMPTIVGILTLMSGKNSIQGLSEPKKAEFLYIYILMSI